jgi:hypothetical protein
LRRGQGDLVKIICKIVSQAVEGLVEDEKRLAKDVAIESFVNEVWFDLQSDSFGFTKGGGAQGRNHDKK